MEYTELTLKGPNRNWTLGRRTLIMGILNVTPDSFSDGGVFIETKRAVERAAEMTEEGADIIDVGGESSRPGAEPVDLAEEIKRVIPVVRELAKKDIAVSVDTTKSRVAEAALKEGAEIINDISAMRFDPEMAGVCARLRASVVLMHMRGEPRTMQKDVEYNDMIPEILDFLKQRLEFAAGEGIEPERTVIDPGVGFGKSLKGNLQIIKQLKEFKTLGRPVLLGTSRKSFIGGTLGADVDQRLFGTIATQCAGILNGAHIIRVHDVKEARQAADMVDAIRNIN